MDLMWLVNDARIEDIRERIPDPAYRRNFLGLAKKIAPDGERISLVGYTTVTEGEARTVSVTRPASKLPESTDIDGQPTEPQIVVLEGTLLYADAIGQDQIKVIDNRQKSHTLNVPEGMMNDIVRPMWDCISRVKVRDDGRVGPSSFRT